LISGKMTFGNMVLCHILIWPFFHKYNFFSLLLALLMYSSIFMRFAWKVNPRNLLLLSCHFTNTCAQLTQGTRFLKNKYSKTDV
jgi:hypothetical protein